MEVNKRKRQKRIILITAFGLSVSTLLLFYFGLPLVFRAVAPEEIPLTLQERELEDSIKKVFNCSGIRREPSEFTQNTKHKTGYYISIQNIPYSELIDVDSLKIIAREIAKKSYTEITKKSPKFNKYGVNYYIIGGPDPNTFYDNGSLDNEKVKSYTEINFSFSTEELESSPN